jgi:CheY-like chemotaxis protein
MDHGHHFHKLRVLVVDDDPDAAESTATLASLAGFDACFATSGEDALGHAEENPPHVVLLDVMMPGMDGYELARLLRNRAGGKQPLLVAVTGCASPGFKWGSAEAGIDLHLNKPVEPAVLVGVLQRFARLLTSV